MLSPEEYAALTHDTTQTLIKDTLGGRKNISPQNVYEVAQLYACGALKVQCVGLQCVGFGEGLYQALLEQAEVCKRAGRWRGVVPGVGVIGSGVPVGGGLGTAGAAWNVAANLVGSGQGTVPEIVKLPTMSGIGSENASSEDFANF